MWGEGEVTRPRGSSPLLGNQRLIKASESCRSYIYEDALFLFSIDDVVHVSDVPPLYTFGFNICCSTPLSFLLPTESRTLSALGSDSSLVQQTDTGSTVLRGGSRFLFESTSPGEVGDLIWRRGSRSSTGTVFSQAAESVFGLTSVVGEEARVPLGVSAILVYKKGDAKFRRFR